MTTTKPTQSPFREGSPANRTIKALTEVMAALRDPETGCPWDIEQDFASIVPYTIEEAYEVADAINRDHAIDLCDELGDLLLQVVYHAQMAKDADLFELSDVIEGITNKMIRRHPHVFGSPEERQAGAIKGSWDRIKAQEKLHRAQRLAKTPANKQSLSGRTITSPAEANIAPAPQQRVLADVSSTLPALQKAIKLQNKAAKVGFDWPSLAPVFAKMREELHELEDAHTNTPQPTQPSSSPSATDALSESRNPTDDEVEEFGDLLFVMANVARHMNINPEVALEAANQKFIRRFSGIEDHLQALGKTPQQSNLEEMDALWDQVKAKEKKQKTEPKVAGTKS